MTKESKPTEGPWQYGKSGESIINGKKESHPATVKRVYTDEQGRRCTAFVAICNATTLDNDANANFIAEAPDTIAALQSKLERMPCGHRRCDWVECKGCNHSSVETHIQCPECLGVGGYCLSCRAVQEAMEAERERIAKWLEWHRTCGESKFSLHIVEIIAPGAPDEKLKFTADAVRALGPSPALADALRRARLEEAEEWEENHAWDDSYKWRQERLAELRGTS